MESTDYLKFIVAFIFVLSLMWGLAYVMKRFNLGQSGGLIAPKNRRLKIIETLSLSPKHKAVLLGRDGTQHLVILNPNGDTVVETNIEPVDAPTDTK